MNKIRLIAAAVLVASLASCSNQYSIETVQEFQKGQEVGFTVSKLVNSEASKTKVSHEFNEDGTQLLNKWQENDGIKLFTEGFASVWGENDGLFQVVDPDSSVIVFRGIATIGKPAEAVYPFDADLIIEGGKLKGVNLPEFQYGDGREATFVASYTSEGAYNFVFKPVHSIVVLDRAAFLEKIGVTLLEMGNFTVKVTENDSSRTAKTYKVRPSNYNESKYWFIAIDPVENENSVLSIEFQNNRKLAVNVSPGNDGAAVAYNISPDAVVSTIPQGFVDLGVVNSKGQKVFWAKENLKLLGDKDWYYGTRFWFGSPEIIYTKYDKSNWGLTFTADSLNTYGFHWNMYPVETKDKYSFRAGDEVQRPAMEVALSDDIAYLTNSAWRTPSADDFTALCEQCFMVVNWETGWIRAYKAKEKSHKGISAIGNTQNIADWNFYFYQTNADNKYLGDRGDNIVPIEHRYTDADLHIDFISDGYAKMTKITYLGKKSGTEEDDTDYSKEIPKYTKARTEGTEYTLDQMFWTRTLEQYHSAPLFFGNVGKYESNAWKNFVPRVEKQHQNGEAVYGLCIRPVSYGK